MKRNTESSVVCASKNLRTTSDSLKEIISSESLRGASSALRQIGKVSLTEVLSRLKQAKRLSELLTEEPCE